jgi:arylsulfatase A-like enzyme
MKTRSIAMRAVLAGASGGIWMAATLTLSRRLTWHPYRPLHLPYDLAICTIGLAGLMLVAAVALRRRSERAWGAAAAAATLLLFAWFALGAGVVAAGEDSLRDAAVLVAAALAAFTARRRQGRIPFLVFQIVLGATLVLGSFLAGTEPVTALIVPVTGMVMLLAGVRGPSLHAPGSDIIVPLIAGAALLWFCLGVKPGSPVPAPSRVSRDAPAGATSCVVVVLDTLRMHNMSLYGYSRRTTPNLERWAEKGMIFDDVTAPSSWTLPSHASLFTGLYPRSHGAHGYRSEAKKNSTWALSGSHETLAEIARDAGWVTAGIVANHFYLSPMFGVDQGFDTWWVDPPRRGSEFQPSSWLVERRHPAELLKLTWPYYRAEQITDFAIDWLRGQKGDDPFLLFLNYIDVHRPNSRPPGPEIPWGEGEVEIPRFAPQLTKVLEGQDLPPEITLSLVNSYDRELLRLDQELGRLLDWIEGSGRAEDLVVVLTSDHGEFFGEHHLIDHAVHLYNEVVRVPLVIRGPGVPAGRSVRPSSLVDVFPTLVDLLGLSGVDARQGVSLLRPYDGPVAAEWHAAANGWLLEDRFGGRFDRDWWTLQLDGWRLFEDDRGSMMLFDLAHDPRELDDLAASKPEIAAALQLELVRWKERHPAVQGAPLGGGEPTEDHLEQIRALGYIN